MFNEFKKFAIKGNMVDMAIGIIIGAAFSQVIASLVKDIIMPPIGLLMGGIDFSSFEIVLRQATENAEKVAISYGLFVNSLINLLIISLAIFFVVRQINRFKKEEEKKPEKPSDEAVLLSEIRDLLKKK